MLSTLAMFVTGVAVLCVGRTRPRGDDMPVDTKVLAHDMRFFALAYVIAIGAALLPLDPAWPKWVVAVVLVGIYGWYVRGHFADDPPTTREDLAPLRFNRLDPATAERRGGGAAPARGEPPGRHGARLIVVGRVLLRRTRWSTCRRRSAWTR